MTQLVLQTKHILSEEDQDALILEAIRFHYLRVDPRKAWSDAERKEAMRYAIREIVRLHFESKINGDDRFYDSTKTD